MPTSLVSTGVQFPDSTIQTTAASAGGKAVNVQTFNSSGTWSKPAGYGANSRVQIQVWGGGGGGANAIGGNNGGGGGGGSYNERWIGLSSLGSTETATVGAGGTLGTAAPGGGTGGTTSLGTFVFAFGGGGGSGSNCTSDQWGGGGGGQLSAGIRGDNATAVVAGRPLFMANPTTQAAAARDFTAGTMAFCVQGNMSFPNNGLWFDSFWHGGGGCSNLASIGGRGNNSVFGGGGGGARSGAGGASQLAGNGGTSPGGAATAPAGGGAGGIPASVTGSAGAAGRIIVTVFDGV